MRNFVILFLPLGLLLSSCTTLPRPEISAAGNADGADEWIRASSAKAGDPWQRLARVEVRFEGDWTKFAERVQPVLTDVAYRQASTEIYEPRRNRVTQIYDGPAGLKKVVRTPDGVSILRNGKADTVEEHLAAAALVSDAYVIFTFGSSALQARGESWKIIGERRLSGETCILVSGNMRPGFGMSSGDAVIAWIGKTTKRLHRVQLTLDGLESTAGADVDVTYSDFQPGPHGTEWPRCFVERVRRPLDVEAHTWRMTRLNAESAAPQ